MVNEDSQGPTSQGCDGLDKRFRRFNLRLGTDPLKGRGLYCEQEFEPGDAILHGKAFAVLASGDIWADRCTHCLLTKDDAESSLLLCPGCKLVAFCCQKCRAADKWHQEECKSLPALVRRFQERISGDARSLRGSLSQLLLVARVLRTVERAAQLQDEFEGGLPQPIKATPRDFRSMAQVQDVKTVSSAVSEAIRILFAADAKRTLLPPALHRKFAADPAAAVDEVAHVFLQMMFNNFKVTDHRLMQVAEGCDPITALINHSCEPNATIVWHAPASPGQEVTHTVVCIKPVVAGDEVLLSYIDPSRPWWARQDALLTSHGFRCHCTACASIASYMEQLETPGCSGPGPPPRAVARSIDGISDSSGRVMGHAVHGRIAERKFISAIGVQISSSGPEETMVKTALQVFGAIMQQRSHAPHMLLPDDARKRLEVMKKAATTLRMLLGPRNMVLKELRGLMHMAEACADWQECLAWAPVVLEALGTSLSLHRVDTLALEAKARARLHLTRSCKGLEGSELRRWRDSADQAKLACEVALAALAKLHGPNTARLPRREDLQQIMVELKIQTSSLAPHFQLDDMD